MNENENNLKQSVTAIAKSGNKLKAVEVQKQGNTIEVIKTNTGDENVFNWQDFAISSGVNTDLTPEELESEDRKPVVVGYDSAGTAFSRVTIPAVEDKDMESMVKLQAESRLPLPANQMEIAWRADKENEGQFAITIAAARRQQVQNFVDKITGFKPTNIYLDCEGIVKVWKNVFSGNAQSAVIINPDSRNTQICLTKKGQLINAVALDMGIEDFTGVDTDEQAENIERFVQDIISIVDLFGIDRSEKFQVIILSDGSNTYDVLASSLKDEGLNASIAKPDTKKVSSKSKLSVQDIFEYRLQIGLALMVIETTEKELNLFNVIYKPYGEEKQSHWLYSPKIAGSIAAAALIIFIGVVYAIDVTKPAKINDIIATVAPEANIEELVKQHDMLIAIERQRPDILKLINELSTDTTNREDNDDENNFMNRRGRMNESRIQLESLDFRKGRKVTITGQASDHETLYNFEDRLKRIPGISEVSWSQTSANRSSSSISGRATSNTRTTATRRTNSGRNSMGGMNSFGSESVRFSMEFNYGTFTGNSRKASK